MLLGVGLGGKEKWGAMRGQTGDSGLRCRIEWHSGGVVAADLGSTEKMPKVKGDRQRTVA